MSAGTGVDDKVDADGGPAKPAKRQRPGLEAEVDGVTAGGSSSSSCARPAARVQAEQDLELPDDCEYFGSYDDLGVHLLMLRDQPRVGAYAAALRAHRGALEGRVVLDVGAGSGILSLLAAKHAGAARVYAVEAAPTMARLARELVRRNGLEQTVQVIEGRAEDVELPEKVDCIVSEWMGFYLLHESMLDSVISARDRWLKPGGLMLPSSARIWAAPVDAEDLRHEIDAYSSYHGVDIAPVGDVVLAQRCSEPQVERISAERLLATPVMAVDLGSLAELKAGATSELVAAVDFVTLRRGHAAALAIWFDVGFGNASAASAAGAGAGPQQEVVLSTGPGAPATHWKQTLVFLGVFAEVEAGESLSAEIFFRQSEDNHRQYTITVET